MGERGYTDKKKKQDPELLQLFHSRLLFWSQPCLWPRPQTQRQQRDFLPQQRLASVWTPVLTSWLSPGPSPACGLCGLAIPRHYVLNHEQLKGHRLSYQLLLGPVHTVLELEVIYCVAMPPSE